MLGTVDPLMVRLLEDALDVIPDGERALRAQVLSRLAAALVPPTTDEANARASECAREALAIARELQHAPTLLHALAGATTAMVFVVPLAERLDVTTELVSLAREQGDDLALADLGAFQAFSLVESGRPMVGRREAEAFYRFMASFPLPNAKWRPIALRGTMAGFEGRLDEVRRAADELRRMASSGETPKRLWSTYSVRTWRRRQIKVRATARTT